VLEASAMSDTYRAVLHGDRLKWDGEVPEGLRSGHPVVVDITVVGEVVDEDVGERGTKMAAALEKVAGIGGWRGGGDPMVWQRETREERPLPDRPG